MPPIRAALLLATLLLGGCASSTTHQQLGAALNGLEGELQRLEEELAAMNGLHYQKAIDAPLSLRRALGEPQPTPEGLVPVASKLEDGPLLRYQYRLPAGMASLPQDNLCQRYEFELRHLGRLGKLELSWLGEQGKGSRLIRQSDCPFGAQARPRQ
ncbi:hypothetical protein [Aeromonas veronii]|uniref:hypothetical protein n=1 Tax=Aeromonas veronii TaxID=654 RepID=UPI001316165E|nr:hypothetical protein [Aeromonas veronii]MBL0590169.1 hypothetical protein [Aeromonas veronii]QHC09436.1 hypothetical protein GRF56_19655 [Aeromonas veronii]